MKLARLSAPCTASLSFRLGGAAAGVAQDGAWRTIEFATTEVSQPDVTLSPDGRWLVFNLLEPPPQSALAFGPA